MLFLAPVVVKYKKKNLDITKPHYSKHILSVPWPFVISKFHCILKSGLDCFIPGMVGHKIMYLMFHRNRDYFNVLL